MTKKVHILRAWGGTGWHVFPVKSMIEYLQKYHHEQLWVQYRSGSVASLEEKTAEELKNNGINLIFLPVLSGKRRREKGVVALLRNLWDLLRFLWGVFQALFALLRFRVDVIFCKGGYAALPMVVAWVLLRKKILVHESDTRPGLVNRIASRFAKVTYVAFDKVLKDAVQVWQILSEDLVSLDEKDVVNPTKTQVLVMWGSQWAKSIYEGILQLLREEEDLQRLDFTLILGNLNGDLGQAFEKFSNVKIRGFCSQTEIGQLYHSSDLVITRAGTTSLAEQNLFWLKMLMIPIPRTHDQKSNALRYVREKGGILIEQDDSQFLTQLKQVLIDHIDWHKERKKGDLLAEISAGKEKIAQEILS